MTVPKKGNARAFPPVRKSLGQHFLSDPRILARIADALALTSDETVVEIGPGRGGLTEQLLARAGRVIAIEIDRMLAARCESDMQVSRVWMSSSTISRDEPRSPGRRLRT